MTSVVLDASAVLAYHQGERGGSMVADALSEGLLSTVNFAEVLERLLTGGQSLAAAQWSLEALPSEIVGFDLPQARLAARLRQTTRAAGLSLGDRACLALAKIRGLPVLTADRAWVQVDVGVEIVLIR